MNIKLVVCFCLCLFFILSCNTDALQKKDRTISDLELSVSKQSIEITELRRANKNLQELVDRQKQPLEQPAYSQGYSNAKYIYAIVKYSYADREIYPYSSEVRNFTHYKNMYTDIEKVEAYNEDVKYNFLDKTEASTRDYNSISHPDIKIESRNCYAFDTYTEASKDLEFRKTK